MVTKWMGIMVTKWMGIMVTKWMGIMVTKWMGIMVTRWMETDGQIDGQLLCATALRFRLSQILSRLYKVLLRGTVYLSFCVYTHAKRSYTQVKDPVGFTSCQSWVEYREEEKIPTMSHQSFEVHGHYT